LLHVLTNKVTIRQNCYRYIYIYIYRRMITLVLPYLVYFYKSFVY